MSITSNRIVRQLVLLLALVNIVVMMVFQYWLPEYAMPGKENSSVEYTSAEDKNVGTIESVEQETAAKEAEEAQTALAREEESEWPENVNDDERDPDAPILELTDDHIYLNVGDRFNYMSYIKTMEDVDGADLSHYIYLDQNVDTSQPGEIELTYRITSVITGKSDSKVLLITIRE